jgi:hypothetical protein
MKDANMPLARTTISIDKTTLDRFFRAYPPGKRSQIIERLIQQDLARQQDRLARAAELVETHADFQSVREDSELWEHASAADGLDSI